MADDSEAFPTLTDADMAVMDELGTRRKITAGEYLYREGDLTYDFMVVVSGSIDVVAGNGKGGETTIVAQHGARKFLGELNLLSGMRVFVSAAWRSRARSLRSRGTTSAGSSRPAPGWATPS